MRLPLTICLTAASAAVLATSSPAFAADAVYGGTDGKGDPIVVKADPTAKTMRSLVVSWRAACSDGTGFPGGGTLTPADPTPGFQPGPDELLIEKNAKGKFQGTQLMGSDLGTRVAAISVRISGALKPGKATGRLEATVKIVDKASGASAGSCQVGQRWSATRQPGVIFGGATSQDEPFIIRLNKQHTRVNDVMTTWWAKCTPDGSWRSPDHFVNFPVKSNGRFGNPFAFDETGPDGTKYNFAVRFSGRLKIAAAKGTLQAKVAETDPAGAPGSSCDSGSFSWTATTG